MWNWIDLYDGKYSVKNDNGILSCKRHGEIWDGKAENYIGDGFVLALVQKIEELEEEINHLNFLEKNNKSLYDKYLGRGGIL